MQIFIGALLTFVCLSPVRAEEPFFEAKRVDGNVEVRVPGKQPFALQKGQRLSKGTQLRSGKDALVALTGSDGSRIKLEGETVLEVMEYGKVRDFKLDRGMAVFQAAPGAAGSFKVRTRTAVMGVRGTQFFVSYGRGGGDEWMCVNEGEVEVASQKNEQSLVLVKAGQGVQIEVNGAISKPQKLEWTEKLKWEMDASTGRIADDVLKQSYEDVRVRNYD